MSDVCLFFPSAGLDVPVEPFDKIVLLAGLFFDVEDFFNGIIVFDAVLHLLISLLQLFFPTSPRHIIQSIDRPLK